MKKGIKISLEGIDGAGKTTQVHIVENILSGRGHKVYVKGCRNDFKSGGLDGKILALLKDNKDLRNTPLTEFFLQEARMSYMYDNYIEPKLVKHFIVLSDRDIDTAVCYAMPSMRKKYPKRSERSLLEWMYRARAVEDTSPDLTLLFNPDVSAALSRATADGSNVVKASFTKEQIEYISEVNRYYGIICSMFPKRIKRIDVANHNAEHVTQLIMREIDDFLGDYAHG